VLQNKINGTKKEAVQQFGQLLKWINEKYNYFTYAKKI